MYVISDTAAAAAQTAFRLTRLWLIRQQILTNTFPVLTIGRSRNKVWRLNGSQIFFSHDFSDFPTTNPNTFLFYRFFDSPAAISLQIANKLDPNLMLRSIVFTVRFRGQCLLLI